MIKMFDKVRGACLPLSLDIDKLFDIARLFGCLQMFPFYMALFLMAS